MANYTFVIMDDFTHYPLAVTSSITKVCDWYKKNQYKVLSVNEISVELKSALKAEIYNLKRGLSGHKEILVVSQEIITEDFSRICQAYGMTTERYFTNHIHIIKNL